jgi:exo-1,4-beta-D-glucosaminidase
MTRYANLTQLHDLAPAAVRVTSASHAHRDAGSGAATMETDVTITNTSSTSTVAFFLRADIRRGSASGQPEAGDSEVLPVRWSGDDITLFPGESETLRATYRSSALRGMAPVISLSGWNLPTRDLPG